MLQRHAGCSEAQPRIFALPDSLATTLNSAHCVCHGRATSQGAPSRCQKLPFAARDEKEKSARRPPRGIESQLASGGERERERPAALSVLCFVSCFYLHRIIYFPYISRTNARYKAVRGAADISTQAGSLETFELLARKAGGRVVAVVSLFPSLSLFLSRALSSERFAGSRERSAGVVTGKGEGGIETVARGRVPPREGSRAETDKINNE